MNIPNFEEEKLVDQNGYLTPAWRQIFIQLFTELQSNLSNEGVKIPQQTADNITALSSSQSIGSIIYNAATDKFMACIKKIDGDVETGEFKTIAFD